jgi:phosphonate degradation associated HDIG domain protein
MLSTVDSIIHLYVAEGGAHYGGEAVTQLEHALQCAQLARRAGSGDELVAAAFLHDIGHLVAPQPHFIAGAIDDLHQYVPLPSLRPMFGTAVLEPIRLHVDAKRYLCFKEAGYWHRLSPASKHDLDLQGGPLTAGESSAFLGQRFAREAIRLRHWDDEAKVPGQAMLDLATMAAVLAAAASCHQTATSGA